MKLIIADDHAIVRSGINNLVKSNDNYCSVTEVSNLYSLIDATKKQKPDVIILDYRIPGGDTFAMAMTIKKQRNAPAIILYTACESYTLIQQLCDSSLDGIVLKRDPCDELLKALKSIDIGKRYISQSAQEIIDSRSIRLTLREGQILTLIMMGCSRSMIASKLAISPETIKSHRKNIMRKLDVNNVASLLNRAQELNLCDV